jgi:hypothetical protein
VCSEATSTRPRRRRVGRECRPTIGNLPRDGERVAERQSRLSGTLDMLRQRVAVDQFHDERTRTARTIFYPEDRRDVRMVEGRESLRLALETRQAFGIIRKERRQDFDRNVPLQSAVAAAIDLAHPTGADGLCNLVRFPTREPAVIGMMAIR